MGEDARDTREPCLESHQPGKLIRPSVAPAHAAVRVSQQSCVDLLYGLGERLMFDRTNVNPSSLFSGRCLTPKAGAASRRHWAGRSFCREFPLRPCRGRSEPLRRRHCHRRRHGSGLLRPGAARRRQWAARRTRGLVPCSRESGQERSHLFPRTQRLCHRRWDRTISRPRLGGRQRCGPRGRLGQAGGPSGIRIEPPGIPQNGEKAHRDRPGGQHARQWLILGQGTGRTVCRPGAAGIARSRLHFVLADIRAARRNPQILYSGAA